MLRLLHEKGVLEIYDMPTLFQILFYDVIYLLHYLKNHESANTNAYCMSFTAPPKE